MVVLFTAAKGHGAGDQAMQVKAADFSYSHCGFITKEIWFPNSLQILMVK